MAHAAQQQSLNLGAAFWLLLRETYAPALHFAFALGWYGALDALLAVAAGRPWNPGWAAPAGIAILFLALFYLRAADEWKDVDYDREFNPRRPLARHAVTIGQVSQIMAASAAVTLGLHAVAFPLATSAFLLLLDFVYGFALIFMERVSPLLRDNIWVNLLVTYPVNILLSIYILYLHSERNGVPITQNSLLAIVAFALAFLHYEFSRKIAWPENTPRGKRLYSSSLGTPAATAISALFAIGAVALAAWFGIWLPLFGLVCVGLGLARLFGRKQKPSAPLAGHAMQFLVVYYVGIIASVAWSWL